MESRSRVPARSDVKNGWYATGAFTREMDHAGHNNFPGCFRCHDGKHFNEKGEAIRQQCTLCHNLPQAKLESGKGSVPSLVVAGVSPPESHNAPNWMREHRLNLDESCTMCHGKLEFGREGGNFCSNPACHGRACPEVNLNIEATSSGAAAPAAPPAPAPAVKAAPGRRPPRLRSRSAGHCANGRRGGRFPFRRRYTGAFSMDEGAPMNLADLNRFVAHKWDQELVPRLIDYVKVPAKSPALNFSDESSIPAIHRSQVS